MTARHSADNRSGKRDCPNYDDLKELAQELGHPTSTLIALTNYNDPFNIQPNREAEVKWFAKLWRRFNCRPGMHNRRVHYVLISQPQPVLMLSGKPTRTRSTVSRFLITRHAMRAIST